MKHEIEARPSFILSWRFLTAIFVFLGYCFQYMLKINLSIAIVCMVNGTALKIIDASDHGSSAQNTTENCPASSKHSNHMYGPFVWSKSIQGVILAGYFYGYILTQLLGGWLAYRFGGRRVLSISMLISAIISILLPVCARWGYVALIVNRILIGAAHGVFWPATSSLWSQWAPPAEKSMLAGMSSGGAWAGNIIALPFASYLCLNGFDGGWASIFYIFGIIASVWSILFWFICSDSPLNHRFISEKEKNYIHNEINKISKTSASKTPWRALYTSKPLFAIYTSHFCFTWGLYLFLTQLPTFLKDVLKFDIKSNGFISALPYIACCILTCASSIISDILIQSGKLSRVNVRKLFCFIGFIIPIVAIIGLSFVTCRYTGLGVALLVIGIAFTSVQFGAGFIVNINEISGPYSGIVFGLSNTLATIPGIISPYISGVITKHQTQKEWQIVFIICAVIYFIGFVVYMIFCDADVQPWARDPIKVSEESTVKHESDGQSYIGTNMTNIEE